MTPDTTTTEIKQFVSHIAEKNYGKANEALQRTIEAKLKTKVKHSLEAKK